MRPPFRPGRTQVHKIDAGQQQHKSADERNHPYHLLCSTFSGYSTITCTQMPVGHGVERDLRDTRHILPVIFIGHMPDMIYLHIPVSVVYILEICALLYLRIQLQKMIETFMS